MNEDLTRSDGVIQCRHLSNEELARLTWREIRSLKIVLEMLDLL